MPVLEIPIDFVAFLTDRKRLLAQKNLRVQQLGSGRFQVNQYNIDGKVIRTVVFELLNTEEGKPRQIKVSGHQILMANEDTPEDIKDALLAIYNSVS